MTEADLERSCAEFGVICGTSNHTSTDPIRILTLVSLIWIFRPIHPGLPCWSAEGCVRLRDVYKCENTKTAAVKSRAVYISLARVFLQYSAVSNK